MATLSMKKQTKSVSLPSRSHPTTIEIEELLNKIKTIVAEASSAEGVCSGLCQLTRLYKCMDDLLTSSTTQVLMSREQNKKWVDELVDESTIFLDVCGRFEEMMSEMKDHCSDLLCALRRRKGDLNVEKNITKYVCFRKKMKKDVKLLVGRLKHVNYNPVSSGGSVVFESENYQLTALLKVVIGVSETSVSVFESLAMFLSMPVSKPNRWSLVVSKLIHQGRVACEDQQENGIENEFESIDVALRILCKNGNVSIPECKLERLGDCIERIESELESMFRCLVRTRVTLLNIISL